MLAEAEVLVPTSLFRRPEKIRTDQIQVYSAFLLLVYSPSLSSHSPTFPSATVNIRMILSSLNNDGDCYIQRAEAQMHSKATTAGPPVGAASLPE